MKNKFNIIKKIKLIILISLLASSLNYQLFAINLFVLDYKNISEKSKEAIKINMTIENLRKKIIKTIEKKETQLKIIYDRLNKEKKDKELWQDFYKKCASIKEKKDVIQKEFEIFSNYLRIQWQKKFYLTIENLSKKLKADAILMKSNCIYNSKKIEIDNIVIENLNTLYDNS